MHSFTFQFINIATLRDFINRKLVTSPDLYINNIVTLRALYANILITLRDLYINNLVRLRAIYINNLVTLRDLYINNLVTLRDTDTKPVTLSDVITQQSLMKMYQQNKCTAIKRLFSKYTFSCDPGWNSLVGIFILS